MKDPELKVYNIKDLSLAPNPRKLVTPQMIEDRGKSILEHGIIQPPLVRMFDGIPMIYAGQVRFRGLNWAIDKAAADNLPAHNGKHATRADELREVNVIVRDITEEQMVVEQWIENLQRKDVTPGEEAEGFYVLTNSINSATGNKYTVEELAAELGFEPSRIRNMLKLRKSPTKLLDAINAGMAASIGIAVGRIPEAKERERAVGMILKPATQEVPLNYEQTCELISTHFMKSLKDPGFNPKDDELVPTTKFEHNDVLRTCGGACTTCEFRSGNNPELKDELAGTVGGGGGKLGVDPNLCTYPTCFRSKQKANWKIVKEHAENVGQRCIEGDAARKVFSGYQGTIAYDSDVVDIKDKPKWEDLGNGSEKAGKWEKILESSSVPLIPALHPTTGKVHFLVDRKEAIKAAKGSTETPGAASSSSDSEKAANKKEREKQKYETALSFEGARDLLAAIEKRGVGLDEQIRLFNYALDYSGADGCFFMGKMLDIKLEKGGTGRDYKPGILAYVKLHATTKQSLEAYTALAMISRGLKWHGARNDDFRELFETYGLKIKDLEVKVKALMKVGKKAPHPDGLTGKERRAKALENFNAANEPPAEVVTPKGWEMRKGELVRCLDNYNCDKCGQELSVQPGMGAVCCKVPQGQLLCKKDGGTWDLLDDFNKLHGVGKYLKVSHTCGHCKKLFTGTHEAWGEHLDKCSKKPLKPAAAEYVPASPEEKAAWEVYLETKSLTLTAERTGTKIGTLQNWHKRRGWSEEYVKAKAKL